MAEGIVVFVTASSEEEAAKIGAALVDEKLAACCNIFHGVTSIFRWKDEICREKEILLILKSTAPHFEALSKRVQELHSYEVPEVIALPITHGSDAYMKWLQEQVG